MKAILVGLGKIGQLYDYKHESENIIFSYAKAIKYFEEIELVCAVDIDDKLRNLFEEKYGIPSYSSIAKAASLHNFDACIIATSTGTHYDIFMELATYNPKAILCEKPIASSIEEAKKMIEVTEKNNIQFVVNFKRRFDPEVILLKQSLHQRSVGTIEKVVCYYGKGLLNNASHMIDLLVYFFGKPIASKILCVNGYNDYNGDYDIDLILSFEGFEAYLIANNHNSYTLFEMDIIGSMQRVRYSAKDEESISIFEKKEHELFSGYIFLGDNPKIQKTDMNRYQYNTIKHFYDVVCNHADNLSSGQNALMSLEIIDGLIKEVTLGGYCEK